MSTPIIRVALNPQSDHGVLDELAELLAGTVDAVDLVGRAGPDDAQVTVRFARPETLDDEACDGQGS